MLAKDIEAYEVETIDWLTRAGQLVAGEYNGLPVLRFNPPRSGYYYRRQRDKRAIVLHFTAGYLGGDLATLTKQDFRVSVPFVVARSGVVVQLFDPVFWSYHLGPGTIGGNEKNSSESIGIELSNIGYLESSGNWLWTYTGTRYCRLEENSYYTAIPSFRGRTEFATFTQSQYRALSTLITVLCRAFSIPNKLLPLALRYKSFVTPQAARRHTGIASHVNFRATDKWDIGPAFDWERIV